MKTTLHLKKNHWTPERKTNPYIVEARRRERFWLDFRLESELIGARLRRLRIDKGYSLEFVAKTIRMSKIRLYKIEHGQYLHFEAPDLAALSHLYYTTQMEVLSVIPDSLFEDPDYQIERL